MYTFFSVLFARNLRLFCLINFLHCLSMHFALTHIVNPHTDRSLVAAAITTDIFQLISLQLVRTDHEITAGTD